MAHSRCLLNAPHVEREKSHVEVWKTDVACERKQTETKFLGVFKTGHLASGMRCNPLGQTVAIFMRPFVSACLKKT